MFRCSSRQWMAMAVVAGALIVAVPGPARGQCVGDCNSTVSVEVVELLIGVNILLGSRDVDYCRAFDGDSDDRVTVNELVAGVNNALLGCDSPPPVPHVCGDGQIDDDEVCDDGNVDADDGCSADCTVLQGPGVIDQAWLGPGGLCSGLNGWDVNIGDGAPMGQEFMPGSGTLTEVAVRITSASPQVVTVDLELVLHEDSITGPVVATQDAVIDAPLLNHTWQRFNFSPPLALTPGSRYVIELVDPAQLLMWSVAQSQNAEICSPVGYLEGDSIFRGAPTNNADLGFVTFTAD